MLALENLTVGYGTPRGAVLRDLNVSEQAGAFVCVLGRNGAGKSTLMRTLAGLQTPLAGRVTLAEDDVTHLSAAERARRIAVVLTERDAAPGLTVEDVVSLARQPFTRWDGRLTQADRDIVDQALRATGATAFATRRFQDLSDGERQRVMIARAIAQSPRMMILDEITAFLDLPGRIEAMTLLKRHACASGAIIVLSSHDLDLSLQLADVVWLLSGSGSLDIGSPDVLIDQGKIGHAFDTPEVTFSAEKRRFQFSEFQR
jgi:iron complex transport system ATP-binding protein